MAWFLVGLLVGLGLGFYSKVVGFIKDVITLFRK